MSWFKKIFFVTLVLGFQSSVSAESTPLNDEFVFWPSTETSDLNTYESDFFRFDYSPNFTVRKQKGIFFLVDNFSKKPVWQIFEPVKNTKYLAREYQCFFHLKKGKKLCLKNLKSPKFIKNLVIFPNQNPHESQQLNFFQNQGFFKKYNPRGFFTRGEMVALAAKLKYPKRNFDDFRQRCFLDVPVDYPYAGEICWAKEKKIVVGIGRNFYPESSINVWGILKILKTTFDKSLDNPNMGRVPPIFLSKMHAEHIAAPLLLRAWELGILKNIEHQSLWANRSVRQEEVLQIVSDFLRWSRGETVKGIEKNFSAESVPKIFYDENWKYKWDEKKKPKSSRRGIEHPILLENKGSGNYQIWLGDDLKLYRSAGIINLQNLKIKSIRSWFDFEKLEGEIEITLINGAVKIFRPDIKKSIFYLIGKTVQNITKNIAFLTNEKRSPKLVTLPDQPTIPILDLTMKSVDFVHFFKNPSRNTRYPAWLKILYPNSEMLEYSILLKARGNANRGYIKPSLTLESFSKFKENTKYYGDEFLAEQKEVKLRSFINEETMIHEKLFYRAAQKIGLLAPNFTEALVKINSIPFGLFQVTEPIKKKFFSARNIETDDYFYAQNINAQFDTNLGYYKDAKTTISAYKLKGNSNKLLELIKMIDKNDIELLSQIDVENIFNYTYLIWRSNAWDSLTHNYYIFWNNKTESWQIFPWDADLAWENMPTDLSFTAFDRFGENTIGSYNKLIHYVFVNLSEDEKEKLWNSVQDRWKQNIHLVDWAEEYRTNLKRYFQYDNRLWNGRFLERRKSVFDTDVAILKLERALK